MSNIDLNDPRLTTYALNEMEPAEKAEFEKILEQDGAAKKAVAEIRATVAELSVALAEESVGDSAAHDFSAAAILPGNDPRKLDGGRESFRAMLEQKVRFPQIYYLVSGLAAACFAVFFVYWQKNQPVYEAKKQYMEVALTPPREELAAPVAATAKSADAGAMLRKRAAEGADGTLVLAPAASVDRPDAEEPKSPSVRRLDEDDNAVVLSPFSVSSPQPVAGYAANSLAGTRVGTGLRGGAVSVNDAISERSLSGSGADKKSEERRYTSTGTLAALAPKQANTEAYDYHKDNAFQRVADQPLSTFSADVDTASYANVRRFLTEGHRPPVDAVRIEELVNYFPYHYAPPASGAPFATSLEVANAPWAPDHRLVRIGIKGREVSDATRPAANLVFLLDVSGSMNEPNKLPLVKDSLRMLVGKLRPDDRVAIAVYAGASGLALPSTSASHKVEILDAIDRLEADGSTNGAAGIQLAYDVAKANFVSGGVNRVILATDGDFNVGVTSQGELVRLVEEKAKSGVFLSVLGFGMGNYKDSTLEQLADKGNGNYAYIDSLQEARKTLVEQAGGTLVTIAKDVKLQVEFNPAVVQAYRLIGYENRLLAKEDFNNDQIDAGEIGAGHTVTAFYEVVPVGAKFEATAGVDALKYTAVSGGKGDARKVKVEEDGAPEMLTVKIRYKEPAGEVSSKLEFPLRDEGARFEAASQDFKFAAAVAAFGLVLRDSPYKGSATLAEVAAWGRAGLGADAGGYRNEFIGLVERAARVME